MNLKHGVFTISLDFELYWGMRDKKSIDEYKYNLQGVSNAIPKMLKMFCDNSIHATWATVGFLFFKGSDELKDNIPKSIPNYNNKEFSPYEYITSTSKIEKAYHFAPELIDLIIEFDGQEIATHTFSHYYCLEKGQSIVEFEEDLYSAIETAKQKGLSFKSLVFPRNQWNKKYLSVLDKLGIQCFRGNESSWIYNASGDEDQNKFQRLFRFIDGFFNLSGHNTYPLNECIKEKPFNFPSSLFLRPYSKMFSILNGQKLKRIKNAMSYAAENNQIFHLWWHPHNFGTNINNNFDFLKDIVDHYNFLSKKHKMVSLNMSELCKLAG
jgi:hypothetical protein